MITILGSTGMLGSMVAETLDLDFKVLNRPEFDAEKVTRFRTTGTTVNCIGVLKPFCDDVERAIRVNALFPHILPEGTIQIATDCVYSGNKGSYIETDPHDPIDVYGKTKSLGEASHVKNLRCSIIGPEKKGHYSLLDWFLSQESADGYMNHMWNGVTTLHFARVVQGVIREGIDLPQVQHLVPANKVSKMTLLRLIASAYKKDIRVKGVDAPQAIDRTLSTHNPEMNRKLWRAAGYSEPPTIEQMIRELSEL